MGISMPKRRSMGIRKFLIKQYNFGPWVGGFKDLFSRTMLYISIVNFILIAVTAYDVTLKSFILQYVPWISFWMYFLILIVVVLLAMVLEFKFIVPSHYTFLNKQEFEHQNLIRKELEGVKNELSKLKKGLNKLRKELNK